MKKPNHKEIARLLGEIEYIKYNAGSIMIMFRGYTMMNWTECNSSRLWTRGVLIDSVRAFRPPYGIVSHEEIAKLLGEIEGIYGDATWLTIYFTGGASIDFCVSENSVWTRALLMDHIMIREKS